MCGRELTRDRPLPLTGRWTIGIRTIRLLRMNGNCLSCHRRQVDNALSPLGPAEGFPLSLDLGVIVILLILRHVSGGITSDCYDRSSNGEELNIGQ